MSGSLHMPAVLALAAFLLFLALGFAVAQSKGNSRKSVITFFLLYVGGFSGVVVATQKDAWPFTTYVLAAPMPRVERPVCRIVFRGVDKTGAEWQIDPYTWAPVSQSILEQWYEQTFEGFSEEKKQRALQFMLGKANEARERLHRGERIGPDRWVGTALSARHWWLFRRSREVPAGPYVALRTYRSCWRPIDRVRGAEAEEVLLVSTNVAGSESRK